MTVSLGDSSSVAATAAPKPWRVLLLAAVLAMLAVFILRDIGRAELHFNGDEAQHAMTGQFFADLIRDMPWKNPVHYTYLYYAQYPSLGLIHWPPLFHGVAGIFILLLGPSVWVLRLAICLFALMGFAYWIRLVSAVENEKVAVLSAVLAALAPEILVYEKAVMLEIPSLAMCVAASWYWLQFLRENSTRALTKFAVVAALALLTKQQSLYLAPFCLFTLVAQRKVRAMFTWAGVRAFLISLLAAVPFYAYSYIVHGQTIHALITQPRAGTGEPLIFYVRALPGQLGWPVLLLSLAGILTARWWSKWETTRLMLLWIAACYVTTLVFATKEVRYSIYWVLPFAYFAAGPLVAAWRSMAVRRVALAAMVVVLAVHGRTAWIHQRPYVAGYSEMAQQVVDTGESGLVLFDGSVPGNFAYFMRAHDPARRWIVLRKALYVTASVRRFGSEELVQSTDEIRKLIEEYGIKYIVIEQGRPTFYQAQKLLRDLLAEPKFKLRSAVAIETNAPEWSGARLELYENTEPKPRTAKTLNLRMLTLSSDISVPIDEILGPKPATR